MAASWGHLVRLALVLTSVCACGHGEPPPARVAPPARSFAPRVIERLAPLSLPHDLVAAGRWREPRALLRQMAQWGGSELSLDVWLRAHIAQPPHPVDLDAPIELLVAMDRRSEPPALAWALSLGVVAPVQGDAANAREGDGPTDVASPSGLACAESRALGPAPLRLVCAGSDDQLGRLLPYATRALPLATLADADVAFSLRAQPLADVADSTLQNLVSGWLSEAWARPSVNERFDAQWSGVVSSLTHELRQLAADLDGASLELSVSTGDEALELSLLAPSLAGRSVIGQLIVGNGASGLAPAELWHAHEASQDAGFLWAFEPAPLAGARQPLGALLGTLLDFRGVPHRLQQQARELIEALPLPRGPIVHASGQLPPARDARSPRAAWLEQLGWQMYSLRGSFDEYRFYVSALVKAFNDPILGAQFGRLLRGALGPRWVPRRMRQRALKHAGRLPRGSFELEVTFTPPPAEASGDEPSSEAERRQARSTLFFVFAPDEDGVKIAWGADDDFLISLITEPARAGLSATLAGRAGLGALNRERSLAGGFYSLAALAEASGAHVGNWGARATPLSEAPHRGLSPLVYSVTQAPEAAQVVSFSVRLPRGAIEDIFFLSAAEIASP